MKTVDMRTIFKTPDTFIDQQVKLEGWIRTNRDQKQFGFIQFHDGTFFESLQVVYSDSLVNFDEVKKLNVSTSIMVIGKIVATPNAKQAFELQAETITVLGESTPEYPLQPKRHSVEFLRTIAHLRPRTNLFQAVFRIRSIAAHAIHTFFQDQDFVYVHSPLITTSDGEGAGEMFKVTTFDFDNIPRDEAGNVDMSQDFFGAKTGLTVTGQLEGEAFATAFKNVYTFGPTFRAENSNTTRHAAEFWMIEPEMAFADLEVNMDVAESMTKYVVQKILERAPEEVAFLNQFVDKTLLERLEALVSSDFKRITYNEAVEILTQVNDRFAFPITWGEELATEHERYLTDEVFHSPVFVRDYPKDVKAFYMRQNEDGKTVAAMDMLVPGIGELIGGSQREERLDLLEKRMQEMNIPEEELWWYVDLRRYGTVVHSGYGIGFERLIMYVTGVENIRDVLPFPRTPGNAEF
ncbi:asparagine--tRNA ligase [Culicoidibacter larvae]|uniref:Asparagine--tRNA ligase n=1 Tax=Culicoidibacter larvae TaxID=2579976 RepID=A0A5R8QBH8_9FIRM|nr:asparagine--tRNA ligase [Culicoidibacter larvae]TLG72975.1 asparagine--tRNA ligase [Culicoidibacter larvae]